MVKKLTRTKPQTKPKARPKTKPKARTKAATKPATKAKASPTKSRRKIIIKKRAKPETETAATTVERPTSRPRQRNALMAKRVPRNIPAPVVEAVEISKPRPVAIDKALYENIPENYHAPWMPPELEDIIEDDVQVSKNPPRMLLALLVATFLLAVFNSGALVNWVRKLPAGPVEDSIIVSAETWHDWMETEGLSDYIDTMRKSVQSLKKVNWSDF